MRIMGIDIGKNGAMAFINGSEVFVAKLPYDEAVDIQGVLDFARLHRPELIRIEKPSFRGGQSAASATVPWLNYGILLGGLKVAGFPVDAVDSSAWTKRAGVQVAKEKGSPNDEKQTKQARDYAHQKLVKARHLQKAKDLFPDAEIGKHDGKADALLIAWTGAK